MRRKPAAESPLYVKLPQNAVDKLHRAAEELGVPKKDIVAGLVTKYLDPVTPEPSIGSYSFRPYDLPEVMTVEQAARFLQLEEKAVLELAEAGTIPGKRIGPVWRFSREAVVAWLSTPETPEKERKR